MTIDEGSGTTMKRYLLLLAFLCTCMGLRAAEFPRFMSLVKAGTNEDEVALSVGIDASTNAYVLGTFGTSITIGGTTLANGSGYPNIFFAKYAYGGLPAATPTVSWAEAPTIDYPLSNPLLAADANGNSFVAGGFGGTVLTFGSTSITNYGDTAGHSTDVFIAKYDTFGNLAWLIQAGGTGSDTFKRIVSDTGGNTFVVGSFQSSSFAAGTTNLTRQGANTADCFVLKYNSSGSVTWAKRGNNASGDLVAIDNSGNCYVGGVAYGDTVFDGLTPTNQTTTNFFIKYNSSGTALWMRGDMKLGSVLAVDKAQNIYTAGTFNGVAQFGATMLSNNAAATVFLTKYDNAGNSVWAKQLPGLGNDEVTGITIDGFTNCWITGYFATNGGNESRTNLMAACYDSTGRLLGYTQATNTGVSMGNAMANFNGSYNYVCGSFATNLSIGSLSVTNSGDADVFLTRIGIAPPLIRSTVTNNSVVLTWPSLATGYILEEASDVTNNWTSSSNTAVLRSGQFIVTNNIGPGVRFFRLRQ